MKNLSKTLKIASFATIIGLLGFSQTTVAAGPKVSRAQPTRIALKTDLRCEIEAFHDAAGTQPMQNGATLVNLDQMWVRVTVRNAGRLDASNFTSKANIIRDGQSVYSKQQALTVPAGFSASFPLVKVDTNNNSTVKATLSVDTGKNISELNELNNTCTFQVQSNKLH
jgi:hypothetical protein